VEPDLLSHLREFVAIPTMNPYLRTDPGEGYGEEPLARRLAEILGEAGLEVEISKLAPARCNLIARLPAPGGRPLLFVAHLDTVPADNMTIDPFAAEVRHGHLYGRGACDNKAALAAMAHALCRVARQGANTCPILLAATADEECGYAGIRALVAGGIEARAAFVGEPTALKLVVAHKGVVRWTLTTSGKSAHAADPTAGRNAIYPMARLVAELEKIGEDLLRRPPHPLLGPPCLNVGTIRGGHSVNTVPDTCVAEVDWRFLPGESAEAAEAILSEIAERHGATLERFFTANAFEVAEDSEPVALARRALAAVGRAAPIVGAPYATEAPEVLAAGIPCVVFGPGDPKKAHAADESVKIAQVEAAAAAYEWLMRNA